MKNRFPTIFIFFTLITTTGLGCATFAKLNPWGEESAEDEAAADPIAAAAMKLRRSPSGFSSSDGDGRASRNERSWNQRYSPPADTISYGMGMDEVSSVWGEPGSVDAAGDPRDGNERWTYFSGLSGRYGLGSKRIVYFEGGRVVGWRN